MNTFKGVADTLFIPLTARIYMSQRFPEYFYDSKALELSSLLPDDSIKKNSSEYSMIASVARYYNLDEMTKNFITAHPTCNIVNLGCGLETAYDRIGNKTALFYEIDLPEVIETRRTILGEQRNEKLIAGNLFDLQWAKHVEDQTLPTLLIVSGVFQYFHETEVLAFIKKVREVFTEAELIFDATNKAGIRYAQKYVKKTGNTSAMMYFFVENNEEFAKKAGVTLLEHRPFFTAARKLIGKRTGLYTRIAMKICDDLGRAKLLHLKLS
ncbi:class I SAM-dependent methyltransferase [Atopobium fossor]|uniref:class I SAM-dependent methyltransferase n=1 Tax=Atopobium fossor TaxID=39487 RepID=UPI00040B17DE|nr:class I SAM-dependent methyltransferase [Atopobium fossor]